MLKRYRIVQPDGTASLHDADILDVRNGCLVLLRIPARNDRGDDDPIVFKAFASGAWLMVEEVI